MPYILHLNDNNLLIQQGETVSRSQGYAWLKGDAVVFDGDPVDAPVKHCRLAPQEINSRYWQQCEQSAIANNGAGMRHAADLVWRHLGDLKARFSIDDAVLVVPSHYRSSNLQLLLGIAKSSKINVYGLVNKAVLALHKQVTSSGDYLHLDVQLHQTVISQLNVNDGMMSLGEVEVLQDVGIHAMQEALLKALQNNFIQNDRFDPLHDAETEQQLFDQLPEIAQQIAESGKASVGLQHQGRMHSTSMDSKLWYATLEPFFKKLISTGKAANVQHVYVDMNAAFDAAVPLSLVNAGLSVIDAVPAVDAPLLDSDTTAEGALVYRTELPSARSTKESAAVDTGLQAKPQSVKTNVQAAAVDTSNGSATHLLLSGIAVPINKAELRTDNSQLSLHVAASGNVEAMIQAGKLVILNDEGRHALRPNDRLGSSLADGVITVIQTL